MVAIKEKIQKKERSFVSSLKSEAKKITWPPKKSLKKNVRLVIISMFGFGVTIYCADLVVNKALTVLNSVFFRLIG